MEVLESVNEGTEFDLEISFQDSEGVAGAPSSLRYKITDFSSGSVVRVLTPLTPAQTVTVRIASTDTRIINATGVNEVRVVSFVALFGSRQVTTEYKFLLQNLSGLSTTDGI